MKNLRKHLSLYLVILLVLMCLSCTQKNQSTDADKKAITNLISVEFKEAYDINNVEAIANMFLEDADLVFPTSSWIKGRNEIREAFNQDHPEGRAGEFNIIDIRFLDQTTAIVNVEAHFFGGKDADGNDISDYWDSATAIMKKDNGNWKYLALRVMPARMDYEDAKSGIQHSWEQFIDSWEKGDADGSANLFTKNTINMIPEMENNVNREGVLNMAQSFLANNKVEYIKENTLELDVIGRKGIEYGTFEQKVIPNEGAEFIQKSRFYAIWKLESDGIWRFHRFIFNNLPPETE